MPGKTKRKFVGETIKYKKSFRGPILKVMKTIAYEYTPEALLQNFQKFYPKKWKELNDRYNQYQGLDDFLVKSGKKRRYKHLSPPDFFKSLPIVKSVCSDNYKQQRQATFNEESMAQAVESMTNTIKSPQPSPLLMQEVDPYYLEVYIAAYHKRGSTHSEKLEIISELRKFNTERTQLFFQKLNSSERNNHIRNIAFNHLQELGAFVRKRKGFKGKKKQYHLEKVNFKVTQQDLAELLSSNSLQSTKTFDCFVSHSYKDSPLITDLKKQLNKHDIHIYYDWSSDNDFLKRELTSEFTEIVLKERIKQSRIVIFVQTNHSVSECLKVKS
ncbi:hypothetical protein L5M18_22155 [Shewanella sp. SM20]|uniref:hypothetical protein n=1 Tax=Shewanella sp. SM20 TaxID=2912792 RepID=UPI0021DB4239|nr:hypothetical protein [Shewanella sp. SM20]MCU8094213.1 hypothetical protein [Shewanella sp. SM20]